MVKKPPPDVTAIYTRLEKKDYAMIKQQADDLAIPISSYVKSIIVPHARAIHEERNPGPRKARSISNRKTM